MNNDTQAKINKTCKDQFTQEKSRVVKDGVTECMLFCHKVAPHVFTITDGVVIMANGDMEQSGTFLVPEDAKVVIVLEESPRSVAVPEAESAGRVIP